MHRQNKSDISYPKTSTFQSAGPSTFQSTQELSWQPFSIG